MGLVTADHFTLGDDVAVRNAQWIYWVGPIISSCVIGVMYRLVPPGYMAILQVRSRERRGGGEEGRRGGGEEGRRGGGEEGRRGGGEEGRRGGGEEGRRGGGEEGGEVETGGRGGGGERR